MEFDITMKSYEEFYGRLHEIQMIRRIHCTDEMLR